MTKTFTFTGDLQEANSVSEVVIKDSEQYDNVFFDDTIHTKVVTEKLISEGVTFLQRTSESLVMDDDEFSIVETIPILVGDTQYVMFGINGTTGTDYVVTAGDWHDVLSEIHV